MVRKKFLQRAIVSAGTILTVPSILLAEPQYKFKHPSTDQLPPDKVKDFVIAGHGDLAKVKSMLQELPTLLYATWDWGGGDFETALEGAGHVGNKEIATYLIAAGARTNLFVLTMLGKTEIVTSYINAFPQYINARGPHGFTFLHHAQKGGDDSKVLLDYFQNKGLKGTKSPL
ncbi:MAG: hypothetical protein ABJA90_05605 [Ginsengibacter sp.]